MLKTILELKLLKEESKNTNSVDLPLSEIKVMNNSPSSHRKSNNIYTGLFSTTDVKDVDLAESAVLELDEESNSLSKNPKLLPSNEEVPEKEVEDNGKPNDNTISVGLEKDNTLPNGIEKLSPRKSKKSVSFMLDSSIDACQFTNVSLSDTENESSNGKFECRFNAYISCCENGNIIPHF